MSNLAKRLDELERETHAQLPSERVFTDDERAHLIQFLDDWLERTPASELERIKNYTPTEAEGQALAAGRYDELSDDARDHRILELADLARQRRDAARGEQ